MRRNAIKTLAVAAAATVALSACGRDSDDGGGGNDGGGGGGEVEASQGITDDQITFGISSPLSGPTAGPGTCTVAGITAYMERRNAEGGIEFGDGKTRTVEIKAYDDAYDPARAVSNFRQMLDDGVFGQVQSLGTPTNLAVMPLANERGVPHVFLTTGATAFSEDPEANPYTMGFVPTYVSEGESFGRMLAESGEDITVAVLAQNDDYGNGYVEGLKAGIEGSSVEIVAEATYEPADTAIDAQITDLASSDADVFFNANSQYNLVVQALQQAQQLGWLPRIFLPSNTSSVSDALEPGNAEAYPAVYTVASSKNPNDSAFAEDEDVIQFQEDMEQYASDITTTFVPHCAWSYAAGAAMEEAFSMMEEPTRDSFMEAARSIEDLEAPMLLDGVTINTTEPGVPPINEVEITEFNGEKYVVSEGY
ncbi:ABC transporter substrate-binding protein [Georgenia halophila]|uniref:ABC transporter substrate-binding protein n=1 Tax=Georgenia halophila TaxID=620889 RepID=A0ABP8KSE9_9MICO